MRSHASGCERCSHDSFVAVNAATGTLPTASAQASALPSCSISQSGVGRRFGVVPEFGGVDGLVVGVEGHHAVLLAGDADRLDRRPVRQVGERGLPGLVERVPPRARVLFAARRRDRGCGDEVDATISPVSRSRISTLVDWVEESTPATNGTASRPRIRPRRASTHALSDERSDRIRRSRSSQRIDCVAAVRVRSEIQSADRPQASSKTTSSSGLRFTGPWWPSGTPSVMHADRATPSGMASSSRSSASTPRCHIVSAPP